MVSKVDSVIAQCFKSGKYSDLTIRCGDGTEFKVHKNVACPQSEYFSKAVDDGRFKVRRMADWEFFYNNDEKDPTNAHMKEGQTGVIELPKDDDPTAVKAMVDFFYTADYKTPGHNPFTITTPLKFANDTPSRSKNVKQASRLYVRPSKNTPKPRPGGQHEPSLASTPNATKFDFQLEDGHKHPLLFTLGVYQLADRIQLVDLKAIAEMKFEQIANAMWQSDQFADSVKTVYDVSPPGSQGDKLRSIVIKVAAEHAKAMFENEAFSRMLREIVDFAADLSAALCGHKSLNYNTVAEADAESLFCRVCSSKFSVTIPDNQQTLSCPICTAEHRVETWREDNQWI